MSKEVKRYSPLLGLARNAKLRRMEMQCDPQWVLDLFAERDAQWVSSSDRVPAEDDGEVLVLMADGRCEIAWATYWHGARTDFACWTFRDPDEDRVPTHWMRLPNPPALQGAQP